MSRFVFGLSSWKFPVRMLFFLFFFFVDFTNLLLTWSGLNFRTNFWFDSMVLLRWLAIYFFRFVISHRFDVTMAACVFMSFHDGCFIWNERAMGVSFTVSDSVFECMRAFVDVRFSWSLAVICVKIVSAAVLTKY